MRTLQADPLPLTQDAAGVIRIGGTRVSLDSLISSYRTGASIPEMAEAFPDLTLSDIHATIAYYLRHRKEVEEYLEERRKKAQAVEDRIRREFPGAHRRDGSPPGAPSRHESEP